MVWFQCEDCGENLKKPKLPNHFRMCSAYKLSCIDCGEMFTQQTIQSHMQCMTEAEKYGPKNQAKPAQNALSKISKPKPVPDVDINVGLSTRPPWFCSLCNTTTTSKQTLLLHADGKKHRNKAKAFHASQNPSANPEGSSGNPRMDSSDQKGSDNFEDVKQEECLPEKKRKANASDQTESKDFADGEVIQSNELGEKDKKRAKNGAELAHVDYGEDANGLGDKDSAYQKISWKKLIISILKSNPDGVLKIKKLQKQVTKSLQASGTAQPKEQLQTKLMDKITSSSRFIIDGKYIHLAKKIKSS